MNQVLDLSHVGNVYRNLSTAQLYEHVVRRNEGTVAHGGPLVVRTGERTGRSPNDKFVVMEPSSADKVWWGPVNRPIEEPKFDALLRRLEAYLQARDIYVQDCDVGADPDHCVPIRIVSELAWHSLFARSLFRRRTNLDIPPEFTVLNVANFRAVPEVDGTNSDAFIIIHFGRKLVIIGGMQYGGETKKSVFTIMNYVLPQKGVFSMHCSANIGNDGATSIFFGLSGTGKTTLSADPERFLIGDDEHGWSKNGIFNFEGGCYAKVIRLSEEAEPDIYATTRRFGTIIENVVMNDATRQLDLDDDAITENTRAAYPISFIRNFEPSGRGGQPKNVVMLTADAFGVLPPVSRLTPQQAMYHFVSGYTAKLAGTETGLGKEPQATFSTCFGAPFMVMHPGVYANLLRENLEKHKADCWLVNTGWTGGPFGTGQRMKIAHTRAMIKAVLDGSLAKVEAFRHPIFNVEVPSSCSGVPSEVLNPRNTWSDKELYDAKAAELAEKFKKNFETYASGMEEAVVAAGPR